MKAMRRLGLSIGLAFLIITSSGCIISLDNEENPSFGEVQRDCVVPNHRLVESQPAPFSFAFREGVYWVFGETWLKSENASGRAVLDNSAARVADIDAACAGKIEFASDKSGAPDQFIPLSDDEIAQNNKGDQGRIALWPVGGFLYKERGHVYYDKIIIRDSYFDTTRIGTGLCVFKPGGWCERVQPGLYDGEPTLLWRWPQPTWGQGAFVARDGYAYLHNCFKNGDFDNRCRVARVKPDKAADPAAYRFLKSDGSWSSLMEDAAAPISGPTDLSMSYNPYLGIYTVYSVGFLDRNIELRRSQEPWGDFDEPVTLFLAQQPDSWFVGGVQEHAGFRSEDGRDVVLTYNSPSDKGSGVHLVVYRLSPGLK